MDEICIPNSIGCCMATFVMVVDVVYVYTYVRLSKTANPSFLNGLDY